MSERLERFGPYLVFIAAMLWASDAPFRVYLTQELSSTLIVLAEHFVDVLIILPVLFFTWREVRSLNFKQWLAVLFIGIGGSALALIFFTQAFTYMNPSVAIILQKLQPLIAIVLAIGILKETTSNRFWLWTLLAIVGAYIVSFPDIVPQVYEGETFNPHIIGVLLALGAAILWGASTVFGRYVLTTVSFKAMTALRFTTAFLFLLIYNVLRGELTQITTMTSTDWLFIIITAVTSGVVSLFIYYKGLQHTKASIATIAELGFPVAAVVINYFFIDATLTLVQLLGMAAVLYAVLKLSGLNQETALTKHSDHTPVSL